MSAVLMWEVRAAEGREDELLAYVLDLAAPTAQVYRSSDAPPRVVVIDPSGRGIPDVAPELVARSPSSWRFEAVPR
jgi:hypothetical protein